MPDFVDVPDPQVGPTATGRIRYDLRHPETPRHDGPPPLLLIGGMTQTVASWSGQTRPLSATRTVLAYEARGQGATALALADTGFSRHVQDAANLLQALALPGPVDVCGFSFGARVALALAAQRPDLVRRLVLSGVARDRTVLAQCIIAGWRASLHTGNLEALARVSLPDTVGAAYLEAHAALIEPMVKAVVQRNAYDGIVALFRDTMETSAGTSPDAESPWSLEALAARVTCPALVLTGADDRLAPPAEARALAETLHAEHHVFAGVGHTIPIEAAEPWRHAVLAFLDAPA